MTAEDPRRDGSAVLRARAAVLAQHDDQDARADVVEVIPFSVGGRLYAVAANLVLQVRRLTGVARLPASPASLLGITRIHSTVVPLFDLSALLGGTVGAGEQGEWVLVLGDEDHPDLGIAATSVDGIRAVPRDDIVDTAGVAPETVGLWGVTPGGLSVIDAGALLAAPPVFATQALQNAPTEGLGSSPAPQRGQG